MFGLLTRRQVDAELTEQAKADEKFRLQSFRQLEAMVETYRREHINLSSALTSYSRTLSAQDDTVRLHLARIEFLQRSLTDATTTTESWAEDRKGALDRIAELEHDLAAQEECTATAIEDKWQVLKALGESRARYGDLEARLAPADAENVGLVQARIRRLIEVLWASRRSLQERTAELTDRIISAKLQNAVPLSAFDDPRNKSLAVERVLNGERWAK